MKFSINKKEKKNHYEADNYHLENKQANTFKLLKRYIQYYSYIYFKFF